MVFDYGLSVSPFLYQFLTKTAIARHVPVEIKDINKILIQKNKNRKNINNANPLSFCSFFCWILLMVFYWHTRLAGDQVLSDPLKTSSFLALGRSHIAVQRIGTDSVRPKEWKVSGSGTENPRNRQRSESSRCSLSFGMLRPVALEGKQKRPIIEACGPVSSFPSQHPGLQGPPKPGTSRS